VAPGGRMDVLLRREAARLGAQLVYRVQVSGMDAAARIVAAGLGAAVLPREAIANTPAAQRLAVVPLSDDWAQRRFMVCTRSGAAVAAAARLLAEHLHTQAQAHA
jgi:DNA-binding transcriptional LysR family regulator